MATKNDHPDLLECEEYTFRDAAIKWVSPDTDEKIIRAALKRLLNAYKIGKLITNVLYTSVEDFTRQFYDKIFGMFYMNRINGDLYFKDSSQWVNLSEEDRELAIWIDRGNYRDQNYRINWRISSIKYLEYRGYYDEELFNKDQVICPWSIISGGNIHDYCINEGIIHPYFNPETVTPKQEPEPKPDTPADATPETAAQTDIDEPQKQQRNRVRRTHNLNIDLGKKVTLDPVLYEVLSSMPQRDKEIMTTKFEYKAKNKDVAAFHGVADARVSQVIKAFSNAVKTYNPAQRELIKRALTGKK